jgi:hypothetical protein
VVSIIKVVSIFRITILDLNPLWVKPRDYLKARTHYKDDLGIVWSKRRQQ